MRVKKIQYLLTPCLFLFNSLLFADTGIAVFSAYTYINDLGLSLQDASNNKTISRSGIKLGVNANWSDINYQGGSSVALFINQDTDVSDNRNIRDIGISALYLQALSKKWLLRSHLGIEQYRNDVLLSTSFDGLSVNLTAGYMGAENSGVDIKLKQFYENHQQDSRDQYNTSRRLLSLSYYFPSNNSHQWSMQIQRQYNNANDSARDYVSDLISIAYKNWRYKSLQVNFMLQQRKDVYALSDPQTRRDKLSFFALDILKPINKQWLFRTSLSAGYFDSNFSNQTQDYLQITIGVQTQL